MRSRSAQTAVRDILHHIDLVNDFVQGFSRSSFGQDTRTIYAVTRCLEIISEASRRLPEDLKARHPLIEWKQMAAAGNIYRHDYEDVTAQFIWDTAARALPALKAALEAEAKRL